MTNILSRCWKIIELHQAAVLTSDDALTWSRCDGSTGYQYGLTIWRAEQQRQQKPCHPDGSLQSANQRPATCCKRRPAADSDFDGHWVELQQTNITWTHVRNSAKLPDWMHRRHDQRTVGGRQVGDFEVGDHTNSRRTDHENDGIQWLHDGIKAPSAFAAQCQWLGGVCWRRAAWSNTFSIGQTLWLAASRKLSID